MLRGGPFGVSCAWAWVLSERTHGRPKKVGPGLQYTLTGRDWKYFHATEQPDELYDLRSDLLELENVIEQHLQRADELRQRLLAWLAEAGALEHDAADLPADYLEELRALGYVD